MLRSTLALSAAALAASMAFAPAPAVAQDTFEAQILARKGEMRNMALNLGVLGGMARGNVEYNTETATLAAENLVTISQIHQAFSWPEGSDNASVEGTLALPVIWEDFDGFAQDWADFGTAAAALLEVAGGGQEGLGAAVGAVGGTCQACHEGYRQNDS